MASDLADLQARLETLEERAAHQEKTISDLNEVVTSQWRKIDALERELKMMREEIETIDLPRGAPEPPPPHY